MSVEEYFRRLQADIAACPAVVHTLITFEKRDSSRGFVRGELFLADGSVLHLREFVVTAGGIERLVYAYQYMAADRRLLFRYDNADHYRHLQLPNHPHHKHEGEEDVVVGSDAPSLAEVLAEIERLVEVS